jgi:hypothetical protein
MKCLKQRISFNVICWTQFISFTVNAVGIISLTFISETIDFEKYVIIIFFSLFNHLSGMDYYFEYFHQVVSVVHTNICVAACVWWQNHKLWLLSFEKHWSETIWYLRLGISSQSAKIVPLHWMNWRILLGTTNSNTSQIPPSPCR